MKRKQWIVSLGLLNALACADEGASDGGRTSSTGGGESGSSSGDGEGSGSETGLRFDIGHRDAPDGTLCQVGSGGNALGSCTTKSPPNSFSPDVQWAWSGAGTNSHSIATPLVANLTDDNADGLIDLCDIPDVVVIANAGLIEPGGLYGLRGDTGELFLSATTLPLVRASTPAIGDIDGDGIVEIVVQVGTLAQSSLAAFEHDGAIKWNSNVALTGEHAIALADLDNDGDTEIMAANAVVDHLGQVLFMAPDTDPNFRISTTTAADLDDDGDLEVILGRSAWHHDGSQLWWNQTEQPGHPAVGDLDNDGRPEIVLVSNNGFSLLEHDGTATLSNLNPTGDADYRRPATIHDLDGDQAPEFALSSGEHYTVYESDATLVWTQTVQDLSGLASGTAFDFLGDGVAEAIYADETKLWVFGDSGEVLMSAARGSATIVEYPVVADVDNDGSSEIVVVSNKPPISIGGYEIPDTPTVQVLRDVEDRWIQARRIWNQHAYHVTNVHEDGTIPQFEAPHWQQLNTFRTNAQIEGGHVCQPEPAQ